MAEPATLNLPKDLIEPIIQAHIQNALSEALGDKTGLLSKMAWQILNTKVDSLGNPTGTSYNQSGTFLEVNLRLAFQKALQACLVEEMETLIDQKERCQCSDSEACAFVRRIEELEDVLAGVRCCEAACCSQCAAKIAALNIPLS